MTFVKPEETYDPRTRSAMNAGPSLDAQALLNPCATDLVGAPHHAGKPGGEVLKRFAQDDRSSSMHTVNQLPLNVLAACCSAAIDTVPKPCDLAIVAIPAVRVAVVLSAGIDHASGLAESALAAARQAGLRLIGPNCIGLIVPGARLDAAFAADTAKAGSLAFLSQSGALLTAVLDWASARDIGFSAVVSMGDMLDVGLEELVTLLGKDDGGRTQPRCWS